MKHEKVKPQGRPRVSETAELKTRSVSLPTPYWDKLFEIGDGNASRGVRTVLEAYAPEDEGEVDAERP